MIKMYLVFKKHNCCDEDVSIIGLYPTYREAYIKKNSQDIKCCIEEFEIPIDLILRNEQFEFLIQNYKYQESITEGLQRDKRILLEDIANINRLTNNILANMV